MAYAAMPNALLAKNIASYPNSTASQLPKAGPKAIPAFPATPR